MADTSLCKHCNALAFGIRVVVIYSYPTLQPDEFVDNSAQAFFRNPMECFIYDFECSVDIRLSFGTKTLSSRSQEDKLFCGNNLKISHNTEIIWILF